MQLSSVVLEMTDSPALSFRDARKIHNVKFDVEHASILRTTPVPKTFEYYYQSQKTEGDRSLWQEKLQKTFLTVEEISLICSLRMLCLFLYSSPLSFFSRLFLD